MQTFTNRTKPGTRSRLHHASKLCVSGCQEHWKESACPRLLMFLPLISELHVVQLLGSQLSLLFQPTKPPELVWGTRDRNNTPVCWWTPPTEARHGVDTGVGISGSSYSHHTQGLVTDSSRVFNHHWALFGSKMSHHNHVTLLYETIKYYYILTMIIYPCI